MRIYSCRDWTLAVDSQVGRKVGFVKKKLFGDIRCVGPGRGSGRSIDQQHMACVLATSLCQTQSSMSDSAESEDHVNEGWGKSEKHSSSNGMYCTRNHACLKNRKCF